MNRLINTSYGDDEAGHGANRRDGLDTEFFALAEKFGIDLDAMVDGRTELSFAAARRQCRSCTQSDKCRQLLGQRQVVLSELAAFCPGADLVVDLLYRQGVTPGIGRHS